MLFRSLLLPNPQKNPPYFISTVNNSSVGPTVKKSNCYMKNSEKIDVSLYSYRTNCRIELESSKKWAKKFLFDLGFRFLPYAGGGSPAARLLGAILVAGWPEIDDSSRHRVARDGGSSCRRDAALASHSPLEDLLLARTGRADRAGAICKYLPRPVCMWGPALTWPQSMDGQSYLGPALHDYL